MTKNGEAISNNSKMAEDKACSSREPILTKLHLAETVSAVDGNDHIHGHVHVFAVPYK
jgi:hypothetical protein